MVFGRSSEKDRPDPPAGDGSGGGAGDPAGGGEKKDVNPDFSRGLMAAADGRLAGFWSRI
jgi:hypothetical protein